MVKRRTQADKSDASARKVLKAALSLFARQGFRATTMRQIARRSGLSAGNLYHHFGGKEEITFGKARATLPGREIQLGLRWGF